MPSPLSFDPRSWNGLRRCSQILAPTSSGPGTADIPCVAVAPISRAYSGSIVCTGPEPRVARCQAARKPSRISTETMAARDRVDMIMAPFDVPMIPAARRSHRLLDGEALEIGLRLCRIEGLAHHRER